MIVIQVKLIINAQRYYVTGNNNVARVVALRTKLHENT